MFEFAAALCEINDGRRQTYPGPERSWRLAKPGTQSSRYKVQ